MREGIVDHAAVEFVLKCECFNITADYLDRLIRIFAGGDTSHLRGDVHGRNFCNIAPKIIREQHAGSACHIKDGAAPADAGVVKNRVDDRFVSYHIIIPTGCVMIKKCNDILLIHVCNLWRLLSVCSRITLRNQVSLHQCKYDAWNEDQLNQRSRPACYHITGYPRTHDPAEKMSALVIPARIRPQTIAAIRLMYRSA